MRLPTPLILAAALLAPAAALAACGGDDQPAPKPAAATTAVPTTGLTLDQKLDQLVAAGSPGAIAYADDGGGLELHAAGVADRESGRPLRPTDRFRAGSNTKSMVATVVLQLVADGRLSLSDTVEDRLPGILPYGDTITLRRLLNHTSGVPDYVKPFEASLVEDWSGAARARTPRELVAMVGDQQPDFAPGEGWNYSSTGYILAGMMIERATGNELTAELERRIFAPLHMRHTALPGATTAIRGAHSHGYGELDGELRDLTGFNASAGWATGGVLTTAPDMARFWHGLLGGDLLEPAQLAAMKQTVAVGHGISARYGLGLMRFDNPECGPTWGNGGDLPGFSSEFFNSEDGERQAGVIVNINPMPKAVSGEPLGSAKQTAMADALGQDHC